LYRIIQNILQMKFTSKQVPESLCGYQNKQGSISVALFCLVGRVGQKSNIWIDTMQILDRLGI
jgi:hypothetical protein